MLTILYILVSQGPEWTMIHEGPNMHPPVQWHDKNVKLEGVQGMGYCECKVTACPIPPSFLLTPIP